jgi:predicted GNAT family acetyltransferase
MVTIRHYTAEAEISGNVLAQIRQAVESEWPSDSGDAATALTDALFNPTYFVAIDGETVLSYARTVTSTGTLCGKSVTVAGLGDVVTPRPWRRRGYAGGIVAAATAHIRGLCGADLAVLQTTRTLNRLYTRAGWTHSPGLRIVTGESPADDTAAYVMTIALSSTAQGLLAKRDAVLSLPGDEW